LGKVLLKYDKMLLELVIPEQCVVIVGRIVHDTASELSGGCPDGQSEGEQER
jgi:hypothetical protein